MTLERVGQCALVDPRNNALYVDIAEKHLTENLHLQGRILSALEAEAKRRGENGETLAKLMYKMKDEATRSIKEQYRSDPDRFINFCRALPKMFEGRRFGFQPLEKVNPEAFDVLRPYLK